MIANMDRLGYVMVLQLSITMLKTHIHNAIDEQLQDLANIHPDIHNCEWVGWLLFDIWRDREVFYMTFYIIKNDNKSNL